MRYDDGQRRKNCRSSGMVCPEHSNRRCGGICQRGKQKDNSG